MEKKLENEFRKIVYLLEKFSKDEMGQEYFDAVIESECSMSYIDGMVELVKFVIDFNPNLKHEIIPIVNKLSIDKGVFFYIDKRLKLSEGLDIHFLNKYSAGFDRWFSLLTECNCCGSLLSTENRDGKWIVFCESCMSCEENECTCNMEGTVSSIEEIHKKFKIYGYEQEPHAPAQNE